VAGQLLAARLPLQLLVQLLERDGARHHELVRHRRVRQRRIDLPRMVVRSDDE
jgi:hypothetical protein